MGTKRELDEKVTNKYYRKDYVSLDKWISYYYQINLLLKIPKIENKKILEVGVGNKFTARYLKQFNLNIKTCDINKKLKPDYVCDVTKMPFKDNQFDVITCYEVLEHLSMDKVKAALKELRRVASSYVVISVPYSGLCFSAYLKPPFFRSFVFRIPVPIYRPRKLVEKLNVAHHWSLGEIGSSVRKIRKIIKLAGFSIVKEKVPVLNNHHQFWVLKKR